MTVFLTWLFAFVASVLVVAFHVTVLKFAHRVLSHMKGSHMEKRLIRSTTFILGLHLIEICIFGFAYFFLAEHFDIGDIIGADDLKDYIYFSATTYTTLGVGDVYPVGEIRILSGIEALVGLITIGWTIALTFSDITKIPIRLEIQKDR